MSEHHHHSLNAFSSIALVRIIITIAFMVALRFLPEGLFCRDGVCRFLCFFAVYIFIGWEVIRNAIHGIFHGEVFDENFLMVVATLGAFALAVFEKTGDYYESISVLLLFQIGEYFQGYAIEKSRNKIRNVAGLESITLVETDENAADAERFMTHLAHIYTPVVCVGALFLAVVPPLFELLSNNSLDIFLAALPTWIYRALMFLVISCPCALVISIPLTFFAGIVGAGRKGIFFKGCNIVERISHGNVVKFAFVGSDNAEAINAADVVVSSKSRNDDEDCCLNDNEYKNEKRMITEKISHHTLSIVWQNIIFAIGVKVLCLVLSAFGIANMWLAVFADTGVMILAVMNSLRAMKS